MSSSQSSSPSEQDGGEEEQEQEGGVDWSSVLAGAAEELASSGVVDDYGEQLGMDGDEGGETDPMVRGGV